MRLFRNQSWIVVGLLSQSLLAASSGRADEEAKSETDRKSQMKEEGEKRGGGALTSFGGPMLQPPGFAPIMYEGRSYSGKTEPRLSEEKGSLAFPIYKGESDLVSGSLAGGRLHLGDGLTLDNGKSVPSDLYRYEAGLQYAQKLPENESLSLRVAAGYAGDKPAEASRDTSYSLNLNYGFPGSGQGYWMLMLYMANNSPLLNYVPIPGVMYIYKTPSFTGVFGFPVLSMQWTPEDPWLLSFSVFGPTFITEASYGHRDRFQPFTSLSLSRQSFVQSARENDRDRLTVQETRFALGFRWPVIEHFLFEVQAGHSGNRSIYVSKGWGKKDEGRRSLDPDNFITWGLKLTP